MATTLGPRYAEAVEFASKLHADQLRKGTSIPYVSHLLCVSAIVIEHGGTEDEAIAALLHDAVEDQGGPQTRDLIATQFGESVALIVDGCTDDAPAPGQPKQPWKTRKVAYIAHVSAERNSSVILVSAADKIYNAHAIQRDLELLGDDVWNRFNASPEEILWYYASLVEAFGLAEEAINASPETADPRLHAILNEFELVVENLQLAAEIADFEQQLDENELDFGDLYE